MRQRVFDRQLRLPVGVDGRVRVRLANRRLDRFAVDGAGRRKDEPLASFRRHGFERREHPANIIAVVADRIPDGIRDGQPRGEVDDGRRPAVAKRTAHGVDVANVAFDERSAQRGLPMSGGQIVVDDDAVAGPAKCLRGMTADVTGAARDEDCSSGGQWSNR
jgi:hypothetical protein